MRIESITSPRPAASTARRDPAAGRADGARAFGVRARSRTVGANADLPSPDAAAPFQAPRSWAVPEGRVTSAPQAGRSAPRTGEPGPSPLRLLIGSGPHGPEARLQIAAGPLAGTEIQVRATVGGLQVTVLTADAFARQTLVAAMNEITSRLRRNHRTTGPTARSPDTFPPGR